MLSMGFLSDFKAHCLGFRLVAVIRQRRTESLLFLLLWGSFAYFYQSTQQNEAVRFDQTRAIVQDHTVAIDKYWWNSADVIRLHQNGADHIYPNKAPGTTILAIPSFWITTVVLKPLIWFGLPEWIYWHMVAYLTIISTIGLLSAIAAVLMYTILRQTTGDNYFSLFTILAAWLGTMLFPFSTLFFSHVQTAALLVIGFYLVFRFRQDQCITTRSSSLRLGGAGFLLAFSVATEYPAALSLGVLSAYAAWAIWRSMTNNKQKAALAAAFAVGLLTGLGILAAYNLAAFGKLVYVPYEAYAKANSSFPVYSRGVLGIHWSGAEQFLHALASITIHPPIGILYLGIENWRIYATSPVLWLVLPGLVIMLRQHELRPEGLVVGAMILAYVLFITSYGNSIYDWSGAAYLGPRHIIPLLPFLALPLYFGARKLRFFFYPLLAISVFYMLLATAIEPRVPYPYENPARDFLLPDYLHGRLAQNTDSLFDGEHHTLTRDSTAFNLAKLAHVAGRYQLIPLMIWWLAVGGSLILLTKPAPRAVVETPSYKESIGDG
jgi:hypothetical protein